MKLRNIGVDDIAITANCFGNILFVQSADFLDRTGVPRFLLKISQDFSFNAFHRGVKCSIKTLSSNRVTDEVTFNRRVWFLMVWRKIR